MVVCDNEYGTCGNAASATPIEMHEAHSMHATVERLFTSFYKYRILALAIKLNSTSAWPSDPKEDVFTMA